MSSWWRPTPTPPAPVRTVAFGVFGHGQPVPHADVRMDGEPMDWLDSTNADGYLAFHNIPVSFQQSHLWVTAEGYHPYEQHLDIPPHNHQFTIELESLVPALQPVRIEQGRYRTEAQWIVPRFMSCFLAIWLVQTGQVDELRRQLQRAKDARCNGIRVFGMLDWPAVKFSPRDANYWSALELVVTEAATYGLYVSWSFFCDAQRIVPNHDERRNWADAAGGFLTTHRTMFWVTANEARKNGWGEADDPALLELTRHVKSVSPQTMTGVSDPLDPDAAHLVPHYNDQQRAIARIADHLVVHPSRMGNTDHHQFRRWLDHLKGAAETSALIGTPIWLEEMMGGASVTIPGRRDSSVVAHVAAMTIGAMVGAVTYMHRSDEDDATPGLTESAFAADIPGSPDFKFVNATLSGSPVESFSGYDKCRTISNGSEMWACAYGRESGPVTFRHGWQADTVEDRHDAEGVVTVWQGRSAR